MKPIIYIILLNFLLTLSVSKIVAQPYVIEWEKCFGGDSSDISWSAIQDLNNEYVILGYSNDTSLIGSHGGDDIWFLKLDSIGNQLLSKCYGGSFDETVSDIETTTDTGFIICGTAGSNDFDVIGNHGVWNYWILKVDKNGSIKWSKCFGGSYSDFASEIKRTSDNGYIVSGSCSSNDGDVTGLHGSSDYWIIKLDNAGTLLWQKCFGGSDVDGANSIFQTFDNGYIVAGTTLSNNGDVTNSKGHSDCWIVKLDSTGNIQWQKTYGGSFYEGASSIIQTIDSGFVFLATTSSMDSDVTGLHGADDIWVVKVNSNGNLIWEKTFGGTNEDYGVKILQTSDNGFIVGGNSQSNDGDVGNHHGTIAYADYWVFKIDSSGNLQWEKSFGGSDHDQLTYISKTNDSGFILTGFTASIDGDVTGIHGSYDYWVVKLSPLINKVNEIQNQLMDLSARFNNDQIIIRFVSQKEQSIQINLYNLEGKLIYNSKAIAAEGINYKQLNNGILCHGFYFLEVNGEGHRVRIKLIN